MQQGHEHDSGSFFLRKFGGARDCHHHLSHPGAFGIWGAALIRRVLSSTFSVARIRRFPRGPPWRESGRNPDATLGDDVTFCCVFSIQEFKLEVAFSRSDRCLDSWMDLALLGSVAFSLLVATL